MLVVLIQCMNIPTAKYEWIVRVGDFFSERGHADFTIVKL